MSTNTSSAVKQSHQKMSATRYRTQKSANGSVKSPKKAAQPPTAMAKAARSTPSIPSASSASPFEIMAARIANRVAEMAENVTFSERKLPESTVSEPGNLASKRPPRKLEMRLQQQSADSIKFSAPFLDNTLAKMLSLQNRMLKTGSVIAASDVPDSIKREQFEQSAELSRIIALICAEKARQGA